MKYSIAETKILLYTDSKEGKDIKDRYAVERTGNTSFRLFEVSTGRTIDEVNLPAQTEHIELVLAVYDLEQKAITLHLSTDVN